MTTTWTVTLVATGEPLGTVEAFTYEEALGRACALARMADLSVGK